MGADSDSRVRGARWTEDRVEARFESSGRASTATRGDRNGSGERLGDLVIFGDVVVFARAAGPTPRMADDASAVVGGATGTLCRR